MEHRRRKLIEDVIRPIAVLVAVAMIVVVGFVWFSARSQDQIALRQSIESVRDAIARKAGHVGLVAKDYSWWNDAVRHLDLAFEPDWAHTNIGFYIYDVHGFELSFVVDRANRTIIGATFVGPGAGELLHAATIAVVSRITLDELWHAVPAFPTVSEVWLRLLEQDRGIS
jgi:sensor domain CHASE-containing protein